MGQLTTGKLAADTLAGNFEERLERLTTEQAVTEASRCLYCFDAPCMVACPTSIDIPSFIKRIATGDTMGAANKILEQNVLGASCARVCATEELCEEACVLDRAHEKPITIGRLQRYATDHLLDSGGSIPYVPGTDTGRSVAVIGGGPAGLAAAAELRVAGHAVTIFERQPQLGGLATYGIIPHREPTAIAMWEVDQVLALGVEARTNTEVGIDVTADDILNDFDAVLVANGAGRNVVAINLAGSDADGVEDALHFIEKIRTLPAHEIPVGANVVVIGAGNTAMDACTIAVGLGADSVTCVYRRTEAEMSGYPNEYELCKSDGVQFRWLTQPVRVITDESGHVSGLECARVTLGEPGTDGRPSPVVSEEHFVIDADHVLLATGQQRESAIYRTLGVDLTGDRPSTTNAFATSHPRVYAAGDTVLTGKELSVVDAVAQGRDAARAIDTALTSGHLAAAAAGSVEN